MRGQERRGQEKIQDETRRREEKNINNILIKRWRKVLNAVFGMKKNI